ncbi:MAG TPA: DUF1127 domain-containing protein [Aurantimonas sp.]|nr:DUF1127 domain-containing protein [Aurantimonas marianensis]
MTILSKPRLGTPLAHPLQAIRLSFLAARAIVKTMVNRRQAYALTELPDYMLKDIGIRRGDIDEALRGDWREDPTYRLALTAAQRRHAGGH